MGIWVYGIWVYGIWVYGIWVYDIWVCDIWVYDIWVYGKETRNQRRIIEGTRYECSNVIGTRVCM